MLTQIMFSIRLLRNYAIHIAFLSLLFLFTGCCSKPKINFDEFNLTGSLKDTKYLHISFYNDINSNTCIDSKEKAVLREKVDSLYLVRVVHLIETSRKNIENTPISFSNKLEEIENLLSDFESNSLKLDANEIGSKAIADVIGRINSDIEKYAFEKNWEDRESILMEEVKKLLDEKGVSITGKKELLREDVIDIIDKNILVSDGLQRVMKYTVHLERRYRGLFRQKIFQGTAVWFVRLKMGDARVLAECECISCYYDLSID